MSILNYSQREFIKADTHISQFIVDRCCDAFDALLRGDVDQYVTYVGQAIAQLGYEGKIPDSERPTAVDKMKTIIQRALADQWGCSFDEASRRLKRMLKR